MNIKITATHNNGETIKRVKRFEELHNTLQSMKEDGYTGFKFEKIVLNSMEITTGITAKIQT